MFCLPRPRCEKEQPLGVIADEQEQKPPMVRSKPGVQHAWCVYPDEKVMNSPQRPFPALDGIEGQAQDWLVRRTGGGFSARDEAAFQVWLAADAGHRRAYTRQETEWSSLDFLPLEGLEILRANLREDLAAAAASGYQAVPTRPSRRRLWGPAFSALALVAVASVTGSLAWNQWQARPVFAQSFDTPRGQQLDVHLPDDSRLRLDTATRVEVTYYRQRREVKLTDGQVMFSVQGDPGRPFDVLAGPLRITVVGTRFAVRHTPGLAGDDGVRVAVEKGRVRVRRVAAPQAGEGGAASELYLAAGQQTASDARGMLEPIAPVSTAGIAPWRNNRLSFDNARLDRVLSELQRYGDTRLVIRDPAVASLRVTGTFNPSQPDGFIQVLPQAAPVRLRDADGMTEIMSAK